MSQPFRPQNPHMRLSDDERADAMSAIGRALAEGRLTMPEYEDRIGAVCEAGTRGELAPLFKDIPHMPSAGNHQVALFSANEIAETHRRGQKTRAGVFGLSTVAAFAGFGITLGTTSFSGLAFLFFLIIPTVFILLYVMKVGPDSWYVPSPRQLERQRYREIQAAKANELAMRKIERREQFDQLTGDAMGIAQRALEKFKDSSKK